MKKTTLSILGATGSIGSSALDIVRSVNRESGEGGKEGGGGFQIVALSADKNSQALMALGQEFQADFIALHSPEDKNDLKDYKGKNGLGEAACLQAAALQADIVIMAISGVAALKPTLQAMPHAARLAIANKECLVSAGQMVMQSADKHQCQIIPVDSEHNALFQLLQNGKGKENLKKITLTASGGPFRDLPLAEFPHITVSSALKHPNWSMGKKNTIDSATMMNKGLEVIEAHHLFGVSEAKIEVLIHRQSLVHALAEYNDNSIFAHISPTDMKVPIAYALYYPERYQAPEQGLDLAAIGNLQFEAPDHARFPAIALARQALQNGKAAPTILNAANEIAVEAFLQGKLNFCQISESVQYSLETLSHSSDYDDNNLEAIFHIDKLARQSVKDFIKQQD